MKKLQNRYLEVCRILGFPDSTVADCKFPNIKVSDLRDGLYPELEPILKTNLQMFDNVTKK